MIVLLTVSASLQNVIVDYMKAQSGGHAPFHSTSMVVYCESLKLGITAVLWAAFGTPKEDLANYSASRFLFAIPSLLYVVQNNLSYYILTITDAPTYQLWANLKIITTGLFMYAFLGVRLSRSQILSLGTMFLGLTVNNVCKATVDESVVYILAASVLSGLSSVYTERLLKSADGNFLFDTLHIYIFSTLAALPTFRHQSLQNPLVVIMLGLNVFVGMTISWIMKHCDNLVKLFCVSMSLYISSFLSSMCCGFAITPAFVVSSLLVVLSMMHYHLKGKGSRGVRNEEQERILIPTPEKG